MSRVPFLRLLTFLDVELGIMPLQLFLHALKPKPTLVFAMYIGGHYLPKG